MTGGVLHTGDGGSSDRREYFIPEMVGAVTGGVLHTGDVCMACSSVQYGRRAYCHTDMA